MSKESTEDSKLPERLCRLPVLKTVACIEYDAEHNASVNKMKNVHMLRLAMKADVLHLKYVFGLPIWVPTVETFDYIMN